MIPNTTQPTPDAGQAAAARSASIAWSSTTPALTNIKESSAPPMPFNVLAAIEAHQAVNTARAQSLALPQRAEALAYLTKTVALRDGTRVQTPRNDMQGLLMMKAEQPDHDALRSIRMKTLIATASLLADTPADQAPTYRKQENALAHHFAESSGVPLHQKYHDGSYVGNPMDFMPVVSKEDPVTHLNLGVMFKFLEHNSLGWSGTNKMPDVALAMLKSGIQKGAQEVAKIHGDRTTIVVSSSGREDLANPTNSLTMQEKVQWADWAAKAVEEVLGGEDKVRVVAFEPKTFEEKVVNQPGWTENPKATVIVGYTSELAASAGSDMKDGWIELFKRPISLFSNDRGAETTKTAVEKRRKAAGETVEPTRLDTSKTMVQNPFLRLGTDKGVAYDLGNEIEQIMTGKFPRLGGQIHYVKNLETREQVLETILRHIRPGGDATKGEPVAMKPSKTGHSHGIQYFFPTDDDSDIERKMNASFDEVKGKYNGISGFPYTVMDYYEALTIVAPKDSPISYADGCKMELRVGVMADHRDPEMPMLRGMPYVVRINMGGKAAPGAPVANGTSKLMEHAGRSANASDQRKAGWRDDQVAQPLVSMEQARMFYPESMSDEDVFNALTELTCGSVKIVEHAHVNHGRYEG